MLNFKYFISYKISYKISQKVVIKLFNLGIKLFQDGKDSNVYVSYRVV